MIAFRYTKTDGAEFLSHLDLLRHIYRTLRRAGVPVAESLGYHAHPRIFLNNPLGVGIKSLAEYGAVDTSFTGDFQAAFNASSPTGVKCTGFTVTDENPAYANSIERCAYDFYGMSQFDEREILNERTIIITDLRGREIDIRPRIYALERKNDVLSATLGCGNANLRPDLFAAHICSRFGGTVRDIIKTQAFGKGVF